MKPHQTLKKYFLRKQKINPKYSLRSFARALKVSPPFVSRMLSGQQEIPLKRLPEIAKILDLDAIAFKDLKKSIALEFLNELDLRSQDLAISKQKLQDYEDKMTLKEMNVLSPWHNIAILELCTCDGEWNGVRIAKRLNISLKQVESSVHYLLNNGYLQQDENTLIKTDKYIRLPTKQSSEIIRDFHRSMMELAVKEMYQNTDSTSFANRLITSTSIAVNPANIPQAKERLAEVQLEIVEILLQGVCTEVYDLTLALFPLTKLS